MGKIVFVDRDGNARAPMAAEIFKRYRQGEDEEVLARGVFVNFEEPLNQKVEAVMASDGISLKNFTSKRLAQEDVTPESLIFAIDADIRDTIISRYEDASDDNTFVLGEYVGEELEVMNPYGGSLQLYGICFESMKNIIKKLVEELGNH